VSLAARSLTKSFGALEVVRGVDLEVAAGDFVSIVGRSGSGKSTLLAMLGALARPTEGAVCLDGTDLWSLPEAKLSGLRCRTIGFVFQFPSLLANLTALDNVAVPALLGHTLSPAAAYARSGALLARVGLETLRQPAEAADGLERQFGRLPTSSKAVEFFERGRIEKVVDDIRLVA